MRYQAKKFDLTKIMKGDLVQVSAFLCEQEILGCKKQIGNQQPEVGSKVKSEP